MKTCKTCTHYRPSWPHSKCAKYDLFAENARKFSSSCGEDAVGYEYAPPRPTMWTKVRDYIAGMEWHPPFV